jgi:putative GTP pyrophosphokinase
MSEDAHVYFQRNLPDWQCAEGTTAKVLESALSTPLPSAVISTRIKSFESFLAKVYRKEPSRDPSTIRDCVGARVVVSASRDIKVVLDTLQLEGATIRDIEEKRPEPRVLDYAGTHAFMTHDAIQSTTGSPVEIELQLRTRAQDAWSAMAHDLVYKKDEISPRIDRQVHRLAALVEIFDEQMDAALELRAEDPTFRAVLIAETAARYFGAMRNRPAVPSKLRSLQALLAAAYADDESPIPMIDSFFAQYGGILRDAIAQFSPQSPSYVEARDWVFQFPEFIVIAERARVRPQLLAATIAESDYRQVVAATAMSLGTPLPAR